ncbi:aspartic proteinase CDR1-like [Tripterygium wilfordii]|uniref:aspartic proteinase CDR1-like n=1 Tax=Tripterygium wilfordii TaxID=458696 RepID=UPI0018F7F703|nr:aspartic proteinase CDR1-like [Tripterygium wilfordii]
MHHLILISILVLFNTFILHPIEGEMHSLSLDLIHHDSKLSPFYNQSMSESEVSSKAAMRSLNHFNSSMSIDAKFVISDLSVGDYFMSFAISDTTERLVIPDMTNQPSSNGFSSSGVLATEKFYFKLLDNKDRQFPGIAFGCDDAHKGKFKEGVQGVVGLGQGELSMVSQLGKKVGKKFSYCLLKKSEYCTPSKIKFGEELKLYNTDVEYKAKLTYSHPHPHYYPNLKTISVNNEKIEIQRSMDHQMVVDIQTSLTSLHPIVHGKVIAKFVEQAGGISATEYKNGGVACFLKSEIPKNMDRLPKIVFHFATAHKASFADFHVNPTTLLEPCGDY